MGDNKELTRLYNTTTSHSGNGGRKKNHCFYSVITEKPCEWLLSEKKSAAGLSTRKLIYTLLSISIMEGFALHVQDILSRRE